MVPGAIFIRLLNSVVVRYSSMKRPFPALGSELLSSIFFFLSPLFHRARGVTKGFYGRVLTAISNI